MAEIVIWIGILFCITQSAIFSGLNLAFFSISRLRLEIEAANNNPAAKKVLAFRKDSNLLLATVLWGNVGINVLLTLLSNSVLLGVSSFFFSTFLITICGEILPQAYFSRNALRMASTLSPVVRFYQILLYIVTKPTAYCLDLWLGEESVQYMREKDLRQLIHKHIDAAESEVETVEGIGALNFLAIDDVPVKDEGEPLTPGSVISVPLLGDKPVFFGAEGASGEGQAVFVEKIGAPRRRWIIVTGPGGEPAWALDSHSYLRDVSYHAEGFIDPWLYCHRPVVVTDPSIRLGAVIAQIKSGESAESDAAFPHRIVLFWGDERRIITSGDILGRLFKGIGLYSSLYQSKNRRSKS